MHKIRITDHKIKQIKKNTLDHFPKYSTYLINRASETAQATRPKVVGQLSEVFKEYKSEVEKGKLIDDLDSWIEYHKSHYPNAIDDATEKAWLMLQEFKKAMDKIDKELVKEWVEDLLYTKTYYGLDVENIIKLYFKNEGLDVQPSSESDESKNIDLYINNRPYQIKPVTHKKESSISGRIEIPIIYYYKDKAINVEFDDTELTNDLKKC